MLGIVRTTACLESGSSSAICLYLESLGLAAGTINQRLAAVRRLAYGAADSGLLSPELAAGIRRVKGVKQLGSRAGNWLPRDQAQTLLEKPNGEDLRSLRDLAMISVLLGCGLAADAFPCYAVAELRSVAEEELLCDTRPTNHVTLQGERPFRPHRSLTTASKIGCALPRCSEACWLSLC